MTITATAEGEGAQALFCYIADVLGAHQTKIQFLPYISSKDSKEFFKEYKEIINGAVNHVDTEKSITTIISYIKKNDGWFVSSLKIAMKLLSEIDTIDSDFKRIKKPGWQSLFYQHGDEEIMQTMADLYKSANNQSGKLDGTKYFGDINKWTPADIYFASSKAKRVLKNLLNEPQTKKDNLTFAKLNKTVRDLLKSGDLLPLSLKKVVGNVVLKKVNFSRAVENRLLATTKCTGVKTWYRMTGSYKATNKSFKWIKSPPFPLTKGVGRRDIMVLLESGGKKGHIQFRHTPASGGRVSPGVKVILMYKGSSALGGQVVGIPLLTKIIETVDKPFADKLRNIWDAEYRNFTTVANAYIDYGGGKEKNNGTKAEKNQFNEDMGAISGLTVMNKIRPILESYFKQPREKHHNVVRAIFAYTASRPPNSARFVIAKD